MANRNAIGRRLDILADQWNEFATDEDARILRWLVEEDEYRMIEAFVQTEQDDAAGDTPDLFLRFTVPFEDVGSYGAALRESLLEQYAGAKDEIEGAGEEVEGDDERKGDDEDLNLDWTPPPAEGQHSLIAFWEACVGLREHHDDLMERLALVLTPEKISDFGEWERWLQAFGERLPGGVRVAVVDSAPEPSLADMAAALPEQVRTVPADLDMPEAMTELARSGGTSTPDGRFRVYFTAMVQALGKKDLDAARRHGDAAEAVAREQGWTHLVGTVYLALAGGYLGASRIEDAVRFYEAADGVGAGIEAEDGSGTVEAEDGAGEAEDAEPDGPVIEPEIGSKLRLQAGMGVGGAWLSAGEFARAAARYTATVEHARNAGDALMVLESWRMASYCHEQDGDTTRAWECGLKALDVGEEMEEADRANSTLPYAGDGLMRLVDHSPEHARIIDERMTALLGTPDWRAAASAPPDFA